VFEPTGSRRDAASVIFNLPEYRVIDAVDLPLGNRRVKVEPVDLADGCPACGVVWGWVVQRVRDSRTRARSRCWSVGRGWGAPSRPAVGAPSPRALAVAGQCQVHDSVEDGGVAAVIDSGRAVVEVAAAYQVSWWTSSTRPWRPASCGSRSRSQEGAQCRFFHAGRAPSGWASSQAR
jgi:transposase